MRLMLVLTFVACSAVGVQNPIQPVANPPIDPNAPQVVTKKLLEFGWDKPRPGLLTTARLEGSVFDGVVFRPTPGDTIIRPDLIPASDFETDIADLQKIKSKKLENSFYLLTVNAKTWDWFDDATWNSAEANLAQMARVAKAGGLRGILFDPEVYDFDLWAYRSQPRKAAYTFAQFESQLRQRGASLMRAYEREYPGITLLMLFSFPAFELPKDPTYETAHAELENDGSLGLFASFLEGMLSAASEQARFIDGNEPSYYHLRPTDFDAARTVSLQPNQVLIAPELRAKFGRLFRFSNAIYVDGAMNLWGSARFFGYYQTSDANRRDLLVQNVFHGLRTADEFVWVYAENIDWWKRTAQNTDFAVLEATFKRAQLEFSRGALTRDPSAALMTAETAFNARVNVGGDILGKAGLRVNFGALSPHCATWNNAQRWSCTQPGGSSFVVTPTAPNTIFTPGSMNFTALTKDNWNSHFSVK